MINQQNIAFEVIAVDGSQAYFLDNTEEGMTQVFGEFEERTGLSRADLELAARTEASVFIPVDEKYYTVCRMI